MKKVLVVDDITYTRMLYGKAMKRLGCEVEEAPDGGRALLKLASQPCDLVLLDLNLPDRSGTEVLREVRRQGNRVPVFVITATEDRAVIVELMQLGITDYLVKPVDIFELQRRARRALGLDTGAPAAPAEAKPEPAGSPAAPEPGGKSED